MQQHDEAQIEKMIEDCLEALGEDDSKLTEFEQTFLEDIECVNDFEHLTHKQIKKLEQIYEDRVIR